MKNKYVLAPIALALSGTLCLTGCLTDNSIEKPIIVKSDKQAVKSPQAMRAEIEVQGRVSTLKHIDIQNVGQQIPYTYSDGKITNSRGYEWWVSKHFALKSDLAAEKVRLYLELLELSYPHYVELFGKEPPNIENQRIAVVYGSSRARVKEAMLDDGFLRGVHDTAGGETMYYNRAGYNFPSHRHHHQRYIVIHETMHAFHMALTGHSSWAPNWITEGLADSIAHHVYDPDKKQLNVMVFDRAPMNYLITGLQQYYAANKPSIEKINDDPALKRGLNFFIIHFLLNDPERALYFRHFMERLIAANPHSENTLPVANRLLKETFPDWQKLELEFAAFVSQIKPTFNIVDGPWEQNGEFYWVRNNDSEQYSRLDVTPKMTVPMPVMDFPNQTHVKPNQAGARIKLVPEQAHRGEIGFAFVLELDSQTKQYRMDYQGKQPELKDALLSFVIVDGQYLDFRFPSGLAQRIALTRAISRDLNAGKTITLLIENNNALSLKISSDSALMDVPLVLDEQLKDKIDFTAIALLSKFNNHQIAPLLSVPSYQHSESNTTNPWGIANWEKLYQTFATCEDYSAFFTDCKTPIQTLLSYGDRKQAEADIERLSKSLFDTLVELASSQSAPIGQLNGAMSTLTGFKTSVQFDQRAPYLQVDYNFDSTALNGKLTYLNNSGQALRQSTVTGLISSGRNRFNLDVPDGVETLSLETRILVKEHTILGKLTASSQPFDGVWLTAQPIVDTDKLSIAVSLSGPYSGQTRGHIDVEYLSTSSLSNIKQSKAVEINPYTEKTWRFDLNLSKDHDAQDVIAIQATLEVDGEPVKLTKQFIWADLMK